VRYGCGGISLRPFVGSLTLYHARRTRALALLLISLRRPQGLRNDGPVVDDVVIAFFAASAHSTLFNLNTLRSGSSTSIR